jgi:hypothetical protein
MSAEAFFTSARFDRYPECKSSAWRHWIEAAKSACRGICIPKPADSILMDLITPDSDVYKTCAKFLLRIAGGSWNLHPS